MLVKIARASAICLLCFLLATAFYAVAAGVISYTRVTFLDAFPVQQDLPAVPQPSPVVPGQPPPAKPVTETLDSLRTQVNNISEDAKRIDRLVTLLLAVTSLYALALGLHSYFGLKQVLDTAQKEIDNLRTDSNRIKEEMERTLNDVREKYPEMANLHANLRELIGGLDLFKDEENWSDYAYSKFKQPTPSGGAYRRVQSLGSGGVGTLKPKRLLL